MASGLCGFVRGSRGTASVEFAVISSLALLMFMGTHDIVFMVNTKRDVDRASVVIARAMSTCQNSSCMSDMIDAYIKRRANTFVRYPSATIDMFMLQKNGGSVKVCSGTRTALTDADVLASAGNIMRDGDIGAAVIISSTYNSVLPGFVKTYISPSGVSYRGYAIDVMTNANAVC
ncbi:Flp pilus assembly protein TadG [Methylobacterium aquaticum]|uniref:Flp pilus assembly protein TadG n=1 Tax=Methylobacterium aquaticum TaxID=270351 RepID=A0A0C6FJR5_9HYPH|nr:Flp pilus assembly protein TadG [Methylobacterium aquaticum]